MGQFGAPEPAVRQQDHLHPTGEHTHQQPQQALPQAVLAAGQLPVGVTGLQQRHRSPLHHGDRYEGVERPHVGPFEGATSRGYLRALVSRWTTAPMTSATYLHMVVSAEPPHALMRCLAAVGPGKHRPMAGSVPRPTRVAAPTRSASVLAWLRRSCAAMVRTQPMTASADMAVPPPEVRARSSGINLVPATTCARNRLRYFTYTKLGMTRAPGGLDRLAVDPQCRSRARVVGGQLTDDQKVARTRPVKGFSRRFDPSRSSGGRPLLPPAPLARPVGDGYHHPSCPTSPA